MEKPLVSVITPMYNGEKYLTEMIDSVINQTYSNWELVIVDDYSTDNSCKIVEEYVKQDSRIRLIKQKKNAGPAEARRVSIKNAKGKYIAFLDCDDIWMPEKLEKQIGYMESNGVTVTCTSYHIGSEDCKVIHKEFIVPKLINYKMLLKQNYLSCDTVVINKEAVREISIESYKKHEDYITWLRLIKQVNEVHGIRDSLAVYRMRNNSRSSGKVDSAFQIWKVYKEKEKLNSISATIYTLYYIVNGVLKYQGMKK